MPATLYYSHRILERMAADRHGKVVDFLEPDAKSQVTLAFENGAPVKAAALVVSTQHSAAVSNDAGQARLRDYVKGVFADILPKRSEEHTSELQSLMRISYAVFCLKKKKTTTTQLKSRSIVTYIT